MKRNLANLDRLIRGLIGIAVLIVGIYLQSWLALLGLVLLATAVIGWCPLYAALHTATYHGPRRDDHAVRHAHAGEGSASAPLADQSRGAWVKSMGRALRGTVRSVPKPYARRSTQHDE
ncbi:MAG: DUF2892 domain-containing protein [Anaerolineae bacterium]|nr:DUF2892 domain-containing protein [Anaerolineae bacterium]